MWVPSNFTHQSVPPIILSLACCFLIPFQPLHVSKGEEWNIGSVIRVPHILIPPGRPGDTPPPGYTDRNEVWSAKEHIKWQNQVWPAMVKNLKDDDDGTRKYKRRGDVNISARAVCALSNLLLCHEPISVLRHHAYLCSLERTQLCEWYRIPGFGLPFCKCRTLLMSLCVCLQLKTRWVNCPGCVW